MGDGKDRFICANCNAAFTQKHSLKTHISSRCRSLYPFKSKVPDKFICVYCNVAFKKKYSLKSHLSNRCPILNNFQPKIPVPISDKFICLNCNAAFTKKHSLKIHVSNRCPKILNLVTPKVQGVEILHFTNNEEFLLWKDEEEQRSCSKFSQNKGSWQTKRGIKTKYVCHRAGRVRVKDPSLRKRSLKRRGSCKINNPCTAFILVEKHDDGSIMVQYNRKHINHSTEIEHLPLSLRNKSEFGSKLEVEIAVDQILDDVRDDVRDTLCDSPTLSREDLVTNHDLHSESTESLQTLADQLTLLIRNRGENEDDSTEKAKKYIKQAIKVLELGEKKAKITRTKSESLANKKFTHQLGCKSTMKKSTTKNSIEKPTFDQNVEFEKLILNENIDENLDLVQSEYDQFIIYVT